METSLKFKKSILIIGLICAFSIAVFNSCDKDEENHSINGKWGLNKITKKTITNEINSVVTDYTTTNEDYHIIDFQEGNKIYIDYPNYSPKSGSGTYSLQNDKLILTNTKNNDIDTFRYILSKSSLEIIITNKEEVDVTYETVQAYMKL